MLNCADPSGRSGAKVTLFESEARCGGHTLTDNSPGFPVDLGFQVSLLSAVCTRMPAFICSAHVLSQAQGCHACSPPSSACARACAQVYNLTTYPNLVGLLEELGVGTEPSDMSFAVSIDAGAMEWGSRGLGALFAQRANLASPAFWRMVWDVLRFNRRAPQVCCLHEAQKCRADT